MLRIRIIYSLLELPEDGRLVPGDGDDATVADNGEAAHVARVAEQLSAQLVRWFRHVCSARNLFTAYLLSRTDSLSLSLCLSRLSNAPRREESAVTLLHARTSRRRFLRGSCSLSLDDSCVLCVLICRGKDGRKVGGRRSTARA